MNFLEIGIAVTTILLTGTILLLILLVIKRVDQTTGNDFVLRQPKKYLWLTLIFLPAGIVAVGMLVWDEGSPSQSALLLLIIFAFFAFLVFQNYKWAIIVKGNTLTHVNTFGVTKEFNFADISRAEITSSRNQEWLKLYINTAKQEQIIITESNMIGYDLLLARIESENIKIEKL